MYTATTYCQDFPETERYDYGSAFGVDRVSFAIDLERHLNDCAHHRRRVVEIAVTEHTDYGTTNTTYYPTNAKPGQLPDIAAVLAAIVPFPAGDHNTEDCPYCDGTGDNRTDPDYSYPTPCYACGGSGISRVQPEKEWYTDADDIARSNAGDEERLGSLECDCGRRLDHEDDSLCQSCIDELNAERTADDDPGLIGHASRPVRS